MITRMFRLALLLAIAVLAYAQPEPAVAAAAMDGTILICVRDLEPDANGIMCEGCYDTETQCATAMCCFQIGSHEGCVSEELCVH